MFEDEYYMPRVIYNHTLKKFEVDGNPRTDEERRLMGLPKESKDEKETDHNQP